MYFRYEISSVEMAGCDMGKLLLSVDRRIGYQHQQNILAGAH
jgi:hypothetical protein